MSWCCCPDTRPGDRFLREISDFRFEIPAGHKGRNIEGKQNSKRAEHISRLYHRFLRDPDFRFQIPKLARFLISDFRLRISDPRTPATPRQRFRFQKTDFKGAGPDPTGFRFQISDPSAKQADVWHLHCRCQNAEFRYQAPRSIGLRALGENQIISGRSQSKTCYHQYSIKYAG